MIPGSWSQSMKPVRHVALHRFPMGRIARQVYVIDKNPVFEEIW